MKGLSLFYFIFLLFPPLQADSKMGDYVNGINLALDPNLISLPLDSPQIASSVSPVAHGAQGDSTLAKTTDHDNADTSKGPTHVLPERRSASNMTTSGWSSSNVTATDETFQAFDTTKNQSLVNNPYKIYSQMPLQQLIPIILQQRQIPFSRLVESELEMEIQQQQQQQQTKTEFEDSELGGSQGDLHGSGSLAELGTIEEQQEQLLQQQQKTVEEDEGENRQDDKNKDKDKAREEEREELAQPKTSILTKSGLMSSETIPTKQSLTQTQTQQQVQQQAAIPQDTIPAAMLESIRSSMVEEINLALNESSLALETVSLLLSSVRENNAKNSISPFLKRTVPLGSLNSDKVTRIETGTTITEDFKRKKEMVAFALGWKLRCLEVSRNLLRETVESLWDTIGREHEYWRRISNVVYNTDVVFKTRDRSGAFRSGPGQKLLAIEYGFSDNGSNYRLDRGVAVIRNNVELNKLELIPVQGSGKIKVDRSAARNMIPVQHKVVTDTTNRGVSGFADADADADYNNKDGEQNRRTTSINAAVDGNDNNVENNNNINDNTDTNANNGNGSTDVKNLGIPAHFLQVKIFTKLESEDDYVLSGKSSINNKFFDLENIREQITRLRGVIFERELMYQLKKECSKLMSYGVKVENENKVVVELPEEKFEIELVTIVGDSYDESSFMNSERDAPMINDKRANLILITLKMLLIAMFKKNLMGRLINDYSSYQDSSILLIRPILGRLRHQNYTILLNKIIKDNVLDVVKDSVLRTTKMADIDRNDNDEDICLRGDNEQNVDDNIKKLDKDMGAFDNLLRLPVTKFDITLPNKKDILILILRSTNYCDTIVRIKYFTTYAQHGSMNNGGTVEPLDPKKKEKLFDSNFTEFKEIEEFLHFIMGEYIRKTSTYSSVKQEQK